jgi:superfamily II DNA helicase RecQ
VGPADAYERELVVRILSGIVQANQRYGRRRIVAMLAGETSDLPQALTVLPATGVLKHESPDTIDRWISAAIDGKLLNESADQYRTLSLTEAGRAFLKGAADAPMLKAPPLRTSFRSYRRLARDRRDRWDRFPRLDGSYRRR